MIFKAPVTDDTIGSLTGTAPGHMFRIGPRGAGDARSSYAILPRSENRATTAGDGTTGTSRAFSFDVSNHSILASVDARGMLTRLAISNGLNPVYETGLPGVFVNKDHDYVEGEFGIEVHPIDSAERKAPVGPSNTPCIEGSTESIEAALIDNLIPTATVRHQLFDVSRTTFAPILGGGSPARSVQSVARVINTSREPLRVQVSIVSRVTTAYGHGHVAAVAVEGFGEPGSSRTASPVGLQSTIVELAVGEDATFAAAIVFTREPELNSAIETARALEPAGSLQSTLRALRGSYGRLEIPGDPFYAEFFERQAELARQTVLLDSSGTCAGSFWGSDPNARPDVWMLDLYYSMLPMAQLAPDLCRKAIDFFTRYGLTPAAWGNYAPADVGHPLPDVAPVSHSVGNATAALALAGAYIKATGALEELATDDRFVQYGTQIVEALLASRAPGEVLFPSMFISDGPSRGDFHTGSNIKAWYALTSMAQVARARGDMEERAASWQIEADHVHAAIQKTCVVEGPFGPQFAEGIWRDGGWVGGHDGEETDLTLASAYGFAEADDERIINHARSAFTNDNPYFRSATGGVSWWDFHFHGPTFPAYVHALAGARDETELHHALEVIRERTDLDGSTWWWPHLEDETDPRRVLRGPGKCGWAAGALITRLIHDIIGARVDALNRRLTFAPFTPWSDLRWTAAQLGAIQVDLEHHADDDLLSAAVANRSDAALDVRIELVVPLGRAAVSVHHDGIDATERSCRGRRFGRTVVSVARRLEPGERTLLRLGLA